MKIQQVKIIFLRFGLRRVGERVRVRHELHSERGHQRASGGRGGSQTGGDQRLPPEG